MFGRLAAEQRAGESGLKVPTSPDRGRVLMGTVIRFDSGILTRKPETYPLPRIQMSWPVVPVRRETRTAPLNRRNSGKELRGAVRQERYSLRQTVTPSRMGISTAKSSGEA